MLWYSHLFQNFPQFLVIDTVKGFGLVNRAEVDVFLELSCYGPSDVGNLISGSSAFSKTSLYIWKISDFQLRTLSHSLLFPSHCPTLHIFILLIFASFPQTLATTNLFTFL